MKAKTQKVIVALSGGVDSAVAAALLKKAGYSVIGVFMKNWTTPIPKRHDGIVEEMPCSSFKDQEDARRVCKTLGIPFQIFNFELEYYKKVIDYFFETYQKGWTPNPDIMCNKTIKFDLFLKRAKELGAAMVATGHYVRRGETFDHAGKTIYHLWKGKDSKKDQSYFLYPLTQGVLSFVLFPIGEMTKSDTRRLAREFHLPNAEKKDSQGICFVGKIDLELFLKTRLKETPGTIVTTDGKAIGTHRGLPFYTIGQRHGIGIGGKTPYYVCGKKMEENTLVVTRYTNDPALYTKTLFARDLNWIVNEPSFPFFCWAKIRYRQLEQACRVEKINDDVIRIVFDEPQRAVALGQAIVFYDGEEVLGGGTIEPMLR